MTEMYNGEGVQQNGMMTTTTHGDATMTTACDNTKGHGTAMTKGMAR